MSDETRAAACQELAKRVALAPRIYCVDAISASETAGALGSAAQSSTKVSGSTLKRPVDAELDSFRIDVTTSLTIPSIRA